MKKFFLIILITFSTLSSIAQSADERITNLLNKNEWFTLDKEYSILKDSIKVPSLKLISEAMLNTVFNQPLKASETIDTLINHYQKDIGFWNAANLLLYQSYQFQSLGNYAKSAHELNNFLTQVRSIVPKEQIYEHERLYKFHTLLKNEKAPEIIRPQEDVVISFIDKKTRIKVNGRKATIRKQLIPVVIHGKKYNFLMDTGASINFISSELAKEIGIKSLIDSVRLVGIKSGEENKIGILDSMSVGNIIYKNALIAIHSAEEEDSLIYKHIDGILGIQFMKAVGEMQIFPQKKIVFPAKQSNLPLYGRNLLFDEKLEDLCVQAFSKTDTLIFHVDTGDDSGVLFSSYFQKYKVKVESQCRKKKRHILGMGGMKVSYKYILKTLPLKVGNTTFKIKKIDVDTDPTFDAQISGDGNWGMAFINSFKKVTLNFNKMFMDVEK